MWLCHPLLPHSPFYPLPSPTSSSQATQYKAQYTEPSQATHTPPATYFSESGLVVFVFVLVLVLVLVPHLLSSDHNFPQTKKRQDKTKEDKTKDKARSWSWFFVLACYHSAYLTAMYRHLLLCLVLGERYGHET